MATVKKYNLAGLGANVELGKQGSYIAGNASAIGFYTLQAMHYKKLLLLMQQRHHMPLPKHN